jgi:uncharacterized protein with HEPN domain
VEKSIRTDRLYLEDIQISMKRIAEYIKAYDFNGFQKDYKTVDSVIRNFEIIGEASRSLSDEIKNQNPGIPWKEFGKRNKS